MFKRTVSILAAFAMILLSASCEKTEIIQPVDKSENTVKTYTGFFAVSGNSISENNTIQNIIAEKTGAKCEEIWLNEGDNVEDIMNRMIINSDYTDYLYAGTDHAKFLDAGAYIPLDEYISKYDNLKNYFTDSEWNRVRSSDGHIYIIPVFSKVNMYDTNTIHNDEAFWIQARVLKWAGYPEITTLDEYFDVIERYLKAHPTDENGDANIGYEILSDGYYYFCLENPPQFLDGYPNDGSCIVDRKTNTVIDYNTTPTAEKWFRKLNEEYRKGVVDPECFVLTAAQYFEKLSSGNVLGMVDQRWNFGASVENLTDECCYVPLGITIDKSVTEHYHSDTAFDVSQGIGVSVSCEDPEGAVKFINDLLDPEILNLRMWGEEGRDYKVGTDGIFYLTDEQTGLSEDKEYRFRQRCDYSYFPFYKGMNLDGKNAYCPEYQPSEFYKKLSNIMQDCLSAYGARTYVELFNKSEENAAWYPMWSYTNNFTSETPYGRAKQKMDNVKHEYLPKVVMSSDFSKTWQEYMKAYSNCDVEAYITELQNEVNRRIGK